VSLQEIITGSQNNNASQAYASDGTSSGVKQAAGLSVGYDRFFRG
jgi:hypothetical protein